MDALRFNKIAAALLSGVLLIMVFGKIGNILVNPKTEITNAYPIEVPEKNEIKSKRPNFFKDFQRIDLFVVFPMKWVSKP